MATKSNAAPVAEFTFGDMPKGLPTGQGRAHVETLHDRGVTALTGQPVGKAIVVDVKGLDEKAVGTERNRWAAAAKRIERSVRTRVHEGVLYVTLAAEKAKADA